MAIHTIACLLMDESHFIPLHSAVKLKKLFSVRKAIFSKPFPLVLHFFLPPRQDITSLVYPDGFRQAQAVWLCKTRQDGLSASLLMPHAFAFRLFFPKIKAFADIHRNVGLVLSVIIRQGRIQTATSQLSHGPSGAWLIYRPRGHVISSTYSYVKGIEYSKMCGSLNCQWLGMAGGLLVEEQRRWIRWSYVYI